MLDWFNFLLNSVYIFQQEFCQFLLKVIESLNGYYKTEY